MTGGLRDLIEQPVRFHFFTGKGGVGKTSLACAIAVGLADRGRRTLLVSTDPASNLDAVLGLALGNTPLSVPGVPHLRAMNIDPDAAARDYRERTIAAHRGTVPDTDLAEIEEQLAGACTVEVAAFDEFTVLLGQSELMQSVEHVIFDTAPTGHTLRLLQLPAAWSRYLDTSNPDVSCLGPLAGLKAQQARYQEAVRTLGEAAATTCPLAYAQCGVAMCPCAASTSLVCRWCARSWANRKVKNIEVQSQARRAPRRQRFRRSPRSLRNLRIATMGW